MTFYIYILCVLPVCSYKCTDGCLCPCVQMCFSVCMKSVLEYSPNLPPLPPSFSAAVFQLQRTADPAGLLRVPPHQQHREAGSDVAHPAHFPPAGGVASGGPV